MTRIVAAYLWNVPVICWGKAGRDPIADTSERRSCPLTRCWRQLYIPMGRPPKHGSAPFAAGCFSQTAELATAQRGVPLLHCASRSVIICAKSGVDVWKFELRKASIFKAFKALFWGWLYLFLSDPDFHKTLSTFQAGTLGQVVPRSRLF